LKAAELAQLEVTIMLDRKSSKIQGLGLLLAASVQIFVSAPSFADEVSNTTGSTIKANVETTTRIAMNTAAVEKPKSEEAAIADRALERKLRKEMSSYVADMSISVF
jgi:hypothetical protein